MGLSGDVIYISKETVRSVERNGNWTEKATLNVKSEMEGVPYTKKINHFYNGVPTTNVPYESTKLGKQESMKNI